MLTNFNKYRKYILGLLLASYLMSAFSIAFYESVHFLCHKIGDQNSEYQFHSYLSHGNEHDHTNLDLFCESETNTQTPEIPIFEVDTKKKIEIANPQLIQQLIDEKFLQHIFVYQPFLSNFYGRVLPKPPEIILPFF